MGTVFIESSLFFQKRTENSIFQKMATVHEHCCEKECRMNPPGETEAVNLFQYPDKNWYLKDTIAAIATPPGKGGIGIVRISGNIAFELIKKIFRKNRLSKKSVSPIRSHHLYYGTIIDPENEDEIDEVILCPMQAPKSYTREDVIEIQSHSGNAVLGKILEIVLTQGARIAEPGEFTKRAFLNGRIDLTQAEAVLDMINAESESARKMATLQLSGTLKNQLLQIKSEIIRSLSEIEAEIDFSDEQGESFIQPRGWEINILFPLKQLLESAELGQIYKEGIYIGLVGKPNVGKSSLLNRLINCERAIVTPFPGTTRDPIEEGFEIEGIRIRLVDTAGIHRSQNPIEILGIQKTNEIIKKADLILFIGDLSSSITPEDESIFNLIQHKKKIIVFNKRDLVDENHPHQIPSTWKDETVIRISALNNTGIHDLKKLIVNQITGNTHPEKENILVSSLRQKEHIESAVKAISNAVEARKNQVPLEMIALDLKEAVFQINNALGVEFSDDILDRIFSDFCIGK